MKFKLLLLVVLSICFPSVAHAYAGPGVAIGAIVVLFTVIITFFASTIISLFNFLKRIYKSIFNKSRKKNNDTNNGSKRK